MKNINKKAPVICSKIILINASPEKVWLTLTDINKWGNWLTGISNAKINSELKPDTPFVWKNGGTTIHSIIHSAEPFNHFGWTGKAFGTFAIHNWTLTKSNGKTQVNVDESMEGLLVALFKKSFYKILEKGLHNWLDSLKKECEM